MRIPIGSKFLIGAPARPIPDDIVAKLREAVETVETVVEGHLPQIFIEGLMRRPMQVLVVVTSTAVVEDATMEPLARAIALLVGDGIPIDVLPVTLNEPMLGAIRRAGQEIFRRLAPVVS